MKVSFEYCHIYPGMNEKKVIEEANEWAPRALKMFEEFEVQTCIMLDDIHGSKKPDLEFVEKVVSQLTIKPDCVYCESEFIKEAHVMVDSIDRSERDFISSAERTWLRENVSKYRTSTEFLLSWKNKNGEIEFSCPALAATSYLTRLGYIKADGVETIYGASLAEADYVVNLLGSEFVQVEDKAQSIVEATFPEALRKTSWIFY